MIPLLLHELLEGGAFRTSFGIRDSEGTATSAEILEVGAGLAAQLTAMSVAPGNILFVDIGLGRHIGSAVLAASRVQAVAVPISLDVPAQVRRIAGFAKPKALISRETLRAEAALPGLPILKPKGEVAKTGESPQVRSGGIDLDPVLGMATSGTSAGIPKVVLMAHSAIIAVSEAIARYQAISQDDVICMLPPATFDYGLYQIFIAACRGATVFVPGATDRRYPNNITTILDTEKVTVLPLLPSLARKLVPRWYRAGRKFNSVRLVTFTGDVFPHDLKEQLSAVFPVAQIMPMYGITEAKRASYIPAEGYPGWLPSVGIAIPNTRIHVVAPDGAPVPVGEKGEIEIESRSVMFGYLNEPELTNERLVHRCGYVRLRTGDRGSFDPTGHLFWHGRADDIVKINDRRVSVREVEALFRQLAGIEDVAVICQRDNSSELVAYVVADIDEASIRAGAYAVIGDSALIPKTILRIPVMPLTPHGKVDRHALTTLSGEE